MDTALELNREFEAYREIQPAVESHSARETGPRIKHGLRSELNRARNPAHAQNSTRTFR